MVALLRIGVVLLSVAAAAASATAPGKHEVQRTSTMASSYDATWTALIDVFADHNWVILQLSKESGLITTDWHRLEELADVYADCGGSGLSGVLTTEVRFNVRLKSVDSRTEVTVNASFRQLRAFQGRVDNADCASRGGIEKLIHNELADRTGARARDPLAPAPNPTNDPRLALAYHCAEYTGACFADASACPGPCNDATAVWCSQYTERGNLGFLCGVSREVCLSMRDSPIRRKNRSDFGECQFQRATGRAKPATASSTPPASPTPPVSPAPAPPASPTPPASAAPTPRGYFCSISVAMPAAGFCAREKADCQRARDAALVAVADLDECKLVETAFCTAAAGGERCAPTRAACEVRARSVPCEERR